VQLLIRSRNSSGRFVRSLKEKQICGSILNGNGGDDGGYASRQAYQLLHFCAVLYQCHF